MTWERGRGRERGRGKCPSQFLRWGPGQFLRWRCPYVLALAGLVFCAGCAPHHAPPPAEARDPNLNLALEMTPRPVTSLDPTALMVRVTDSAGKPVGGADVVLHLDMPAMPMGENMVTARETESGNYAGTGRFTMTGAWRVTASAMKGQERAVRVFPVEVK